MPMIAAPVAAFVMGAGASAAVGALAGAIAVGVVSGAVIGAATAVVTGGNILNGALRGAVIGGISGGVMSGLSMATGFSSASSQLAGMGLSPSGTALAPGVSASVGPTTSLAKSTLTGPEAGLAPRALSTPGAIEAGTGAIAVPQATVGTPTGIQSGTSIPSPVPKRSFFDKMMFDKSGDLNPATGKIIAGGVEGVAKGLLTETPETESQSEYLTAVQARNVAGDFEARTANIKIPDYWQRYNKANRQNLGQTTNAQLTPQQLAALNAQQQQGGAYAQPA